MRVAAVTAMGFETKRLYSFAGVLCASCEQSDADGSHEIDSEARRNIYMLLQSKHQPFLIYCRNFQERFHYYVPERGPQGWISITVVKTRSRAPP